MHKARQSQALRCDYCDAEHRNGELFCNNCGQSLLARDETKSNCHPSFTDILSATELKSASLSADQPLKIHLIDDDTTLVIKPKQVSVLGRSILLGGSDNTVDIDLIPFDGFSKGVSQRHALIQREADAVYLIDQESKNGTFVNGIQLAPYEPFMIEDGDLAHLGSLPICFNFT